MAPMTRFRADKAQAPLPYMKENYAQRPHMPGTLLITENTGVSETHKEVTDAVHARGCYIFLQLNGAGRTADKGFPNLAPSAVPLRQEESAIPIEDAGPPGAITKEEIRECIGDFATAEKNAMTAGFDGVEIHGGNGHLVNQFLQESVNQRSDRWGGSAENRSRFGVEVAKAAIGAVDKDRVGFRISPFSTYKGVKPVQPVEQFLDLVRRLKAFDLTYLYIIESCIDNWYDVDRHESLEFLLEEWDSKAPVLVVGGYDGDSAREAVDAKYAGFDTAVAFGRGFLSTPDIVARVKRGLKANKYGSETFYAPELRRGYIDYPTLLLSRRRRLEK